MLDDDHHSRFDETPCWDHCTKSLCMISESAGKWIDDENQVNLNASIYSNIPFLRELPLLFRSPGEYDSHFAFFLHDMNVMEILSHELFQPFAECFRYGGLSMSFFVLLILCQKIVNISGSYQFWVMEQKENDFRCTLPDSIWNRTIICIQS